MNRKQVSLDLGTPALSPSVQRAGQYSVATPATPKTNSALQLAQALRVAPQVLGQVSNIAKGMGAEAAAEVGNVEEALQDKEVKGILGYDKAYQQGLVKRHFASNEEAIKERFMNLASTDEFLKMDPQTFVNAMQEERQTFTDELMSEFGGNADREKAVAAFSNTFIDGLINDTSDAWVKNKKDQTEMLISADVSNLFKNQGVSAGLDYQASELSALGVPPKERAQKMRNAVTAEVSVLIEQGQLSAAEALVDEVEGYSVHGNAKLFGSTEGKKELTTVKRVLRDTREKSEASFSDNSKGLGRSVDALMQDVSDPDVSLEERKASAMRMAIRAGVAVDAAEAFAETASVGGIDNMMDAYRDLARNAQSEMVRDLLNDQLEKIRDAKDDHFGGDISTIGTFTDEEIGLLESDIRNVLDRNPNTSRTNLPISVNGRKMNTQDPDYLEMMRRINVDYEWATVPSQRGSIVREAQRFIRSKDSRFGVYAGEYAVAIQSDLDKEAPNLYRQAKGDVATYESLLQDKADELKSDYKRRADLRGDTEGLLEIDLPPSKEKEAREEGQDNRKVRDLKSFKGGGITAKELASDREALKSLDTSLRGLSKSEKKRLIQASLLDYGFPTVDSLDLEMLSDANMGFQDVYLGDSVLRDMIPAANGYFAKTQNMEVTKEQQEAMDKWFEFGFDSYEDFVRIEEAQETLRNLDNR